MVIEANDPRKRRKSINAEIDRNKEKILTNIKYPPNRCDLELILQDIKQVMLSKKLQTDILIGRMHMLEMLRSPQWKVKSPQ